MNWGALDMKSETSFFSKTIIKEDLKRFWGIGALYFLALLFTGPIYIFMINSNNLDRVNYTIEKFLDIYKSGFELVYAVAVPIILATLIFRYLQLKNSSGMTHSFPFTRTMLLNSHIVSGLVILTLPILINLLIMLIAYTNLYTGTEIVLTDVYRWFFITLLLNFTVFLMTVFTGMISGVSFVQAMLSLIFLFLPLGLTGLVLATLDRILFGFVADNTILENFAMNVIPLTNGFNGGNTDPLLIIWYLMLLAILFFASRFLYIKRNLENATDPIAFNILKPLFKYGFTFCTMILGGLYFSEMAKDNQIWLYFGFFIGALLGYIISEMIVQKSIWVFNRLIGLVPFIVASGLLLTIMELDLTGYEKHLPDLDKVESAYFGYSINSKTFKQDSRLFHKKDNFIPIKELHRLIVNNKEAIDKRHNFITRNIAIGYKYSNGDTLMRKYTVPQSFIEDNPYIKKIYESEEYKIINNGIFRVNLSKVDYVDINARYVDRQVKLTDKNEINELINVIQKDILNQTYEEMTSNREGWASIRIMYTDDTKELHDKLYYNKIIHLEWDKSYKGLENFFKQKGYYNYLRVLPEDVDFAVVGKLKNSKDVDRIYKETMDFETVQPEIIEGEKIEIRDKEKIEKLLRTYKRGYPEAGKYIVIFHLKNSRKIIGWYNEKTL